MLDLTSWGEVRSLNKIDRDVISESTLVFSSWFITVEDPGKTRTVVEVKVLLCISSICPGIMRQFYRKISPCLSPLPLSPSLRPGFSTGPLHHLCSHTLIHPTSLIPSPFLSPPPVWLPPLFFLSSLLPPPFLSIMSNDVFALCKTKGTQAVQCLCCKHHFRSHFK